MTRPTGAITRTCQKCGLQVDFPDSPLGAAMVDAFELRPVVGTMEP